MRSRRGIAAVALILAGGLALSGCSALTGTDGDLADDWAALPAPKSFVPDRGCHAKETDSSATATEFAVVDCTKSHETETLYVGEFSGSVASASTPPETDSKDAADAFDTCEEQVNKVLGYDWRDLRLALRLVTPSSAAWKGGAHWFACDVIELADLENAETKSRMSNIQDGLPTLPLGCFTATESGGDLTMAEVECSASHNSEYVGSFEPAAGVAYPTTDAGWDVLHEKCDEIAAAYLGISGSQFDKSYSEIAWATSKKYWSAGNNNVRCFLWLGKAKMTGSAKGKKTAVPKWA
ncbi:MAG: septum formation family protein [Hamadaea sp.]|uniref:septum formation family protein n=1 Tax=Hamadaea sp. TaxID=2024425 RepID=UPI00182A33D7|nr:septum formation family protein [Hamadaea sp.]NUR69353.1 septum formation family protein [Hamadaea sp.]NUT18277.1 septum formation family protein [Hamadaea sp.]